MSPAASTTAALVAPTIVAQAIFSGRRAKNGADNMDDNTIFALMNFDIAAGQLLKGARAAKSLSVPVENAGALNKIKNTAETTNELKQTGSQIFSKKILGGAKKVVDFTAYHINPIIWCAGIAKALCSKDDDKPTALYKELVPIGTMRLCEEGYSALLGMPIIKKENGVQVNEFREGCYKKIFKDKQKKAIEDLCATNKTICGAAKGLGFVAVSIAGYKLGEIIVKNTIGSKNN